MVPTRDASRVETSTVGHGGAHINPLHQKGMKKKVAVANVPKLQIQNPAPPPVKRLKTPRLFGYPHLPLANSNPRTYRESEGKPKIESRPSVHLPLKFQISPPSPDLPHYYPAPSSSLLPIGAGGGGGRAATTTKEVVRWIPFRVSCKKVGCFGRNCFCFFGVGKHFGTCAAPVLVLQFVLQVISSDLMVFFVYLLSFWLR